MTSDIWKADMPDTDVQTQSAQFAQRIEKLLASTLVAGTSDYAFTAPPQGTYRRGGEMAYVITQNDEKGVPLYSEGQEILRLRYNFRCSCKKDGAWLQVDKSTIMLVCAPEYIPLVHYDYIREKTHEVPAAHINVHGSNDAASRLMLACGSGKRGRSRRGKFIKDGVFPTFSTLHFPVGGERLRPGLEDVLQMAIHEFALDVKDGWQEAINGSRAEYRRRQIAALVREFPDIAYNTLRECGCDMSSIPQRPERDYAESSLTRY
ncbi:hypothetical protein PG2012B_1153 [Bifidobacterium pseudolongum subsp. globosum]|nr:hypothetical protein PG2012B_1153 [Bifidobacterium pseudolongum subsp. globosum]